MYRIRRFGVVRTATVVAVAYALAFGIVFIPLAVLGVLLGAPRGVPGGGAAIGAGLLFIGIVVLVIYPLLIWVGTAIACLVYNLAARWVGGIEVEIERPRQAWPQPPSWPAQPHGQWNAPPPGPAAWQPSAPAGGWPGQPGHDPGSEPPRRQGR